jgi:hypothetical protein
VFVVEQLHLEGGALVFGGAVGLQSCFVGPRCCLGARVASSGRFVVSLDFGLIKKDSSSK